MRFNWLSQLRCLHPGKDRALFRAVDEGRLDVVAQWLRAGADPHLVCHRSPSKLPVTTLHRAIEKEDVEMVALLLDHGAKPNSDAYRPQSPMTQWLVGVANTTRPTPAQHRIGLLLLNAGGDLAKGMTPSGTSTLYDILRGLDNLTFVDSVEREHLAGRASSTLDGGTAPVVNCRRRPTL